MHVYSSDYNLLVYLWGLLIFLMKNYEYRPNSLNLFYYFFIEKRKLLQIWFFLISLKPFYFRITYLIIFSVCE